MHTAPLKNSIEDNKIAEYKGIIFIILAITKYQLNWHLNYLKFLLANRPTFIKKIVAGNEEN